MILFVGSSRDRVSAHLLAELRSTGCSYAFVDEDHAAKYSIAQDNGYWRISGDGCHGERQVGAIFVRHAVARTLDVHVLGPMSKLQAHVNRMLLSAKCTVVNRPSRALSNYSKPYQTRLLAEAGFDVPRTIVTNIPEEALRFYEECNGRVIIKGVSNVMSFAQLWKATHFERVGLLPYCPTQFQEFISGADYRVHVVGETVFITRLAAANEDYRRSALVDEEEILAEPADLPQAVVERCIRFTRSLGLVVGGIDFKESTNQRLVALELNPYPQFTFYESRSGQLITKSIVEYLSCHQVTDGNVYA